MSSLYYQHRQHEEQQQQQQHLEHHQQQRRREREQHPQQQHQYPYGSQRNEQSYYQSQSYSEQQYQHHQHHHEEHRYARSHSRPYGYDPHDPSFSNEHGHHDGTPFPAGTEPRGSRQDRDRSRDDTEALVDTLRAMIGQERSGYNLDSYFPRDVKPKGGSRIRQQNIIHGGWREKICQWSYNVVDHFDLPREIVSISLNYFDRYMATLSTPEAGPDNMTERDLPGSATNTNTEGSGDLALLASLGTLHLATKVHATNHNDYDPSMGPLEDQHHKVPSLATLANLSRGQFGPASILEMEKILLGALRWRLHPPTLYAFVTLLLRLVPTTGDDPRGGITPSLAVELFEVAMYIAELSVCDAFFVERQIPNGTIALAAIVTAMDDLLSPQDNEIPSMVSSSRGTGCFTEDHRADFLATCADQLGLGRNRSKFGPTLERLRSMYLGASTVVETTAMMASSSKTGDSLAKDSGGEASRSRTGSYNPPTSPSSIADMSLSTINSTIHSMADNTNGGGGSGSLKRGDSMVSSIACQSRETTVGLGSSEDDYELFDAVTGSESHSNRSGHTNFLRYSPSPPRGDVEDDPIDDDCDDDEILHHRREQQRRHRYYGEEDDEHHRAQLDLRRVANRHPSQHSSSSVAMSCSPIAAAIR